nr:hypothetical protein B0A51_04862 [Rachicladosporium sp. CCFEE 5018]
MASGSGKRKRPEQRGSYSESNGRPSPHRPQDLNLAQQTQRESGRRGPQRQGKAGLSAPTSPAPAVRESDGAPERGDGGAALAVGAAESRPVTPAPAAAVQEDATEAVAVEREYAYEYVTEEALAAWEETGRQAVLDAAAAGDELVVSAVLQELVTAGLDGKLDPVVAGETVKELIVRQSEDSDIAALFLDTISLLDDVDTKNTALSKMVTATGIDPEIIRQELDITLLMALGLTRTTFERMRTRKTTSLLYRQANFNLLREETEGYAKLLTDYYNAASDSVNSDDTEMAKDAFHRIMALVGAFDLDVGRVLDITLDISASLLVKSFRFFIKFYRCSSWWPQNDALDNIQWEEQEFGSLPSWALPGSGRWATSDEDRAGLQQARQARDVQFWDRVRELGLDAYFELGARRITNYDEALPVLEAEIPVQVDGRGKELNENQRKRANENREYMRRTKCLPPSGNADAAQLLGFKLRFYASPARDVEDVLPENLIYLAALLIKIGFISLRDLYPHLYPLDEDMPAYRERLEKEKADKERKERPGGGVNALAAAGALADDTLPAMNRLRNENKAASGANSPKSDKKEEESKEELPEPTNQKLVLLKALLAIGALPEALFILGRFPWLADVDTSLPPYLQRILTRMLSKVGEESDPLQDRADLQDTKRQLADTLPDAEGVLKLASRQKTRSRRWLGLDEVDAGDGVEQKHYYADWDDNIPVCQTVDDVFALSSTFLGFLGFKLGLDVLNMTRMLRIAKRSLQQDSLEFNRTRWLDMMRRQLVPALSLTKHNLNVTEEVWDLLKMYPLTTRYDIYTEWFIGRTSRSPDVKIALDRNKAEAKDVLRRITNESGKKGARALGKVALASPGVVVATFINQLESYSNMIPGLVDSVRYFSRLGFDVLIWCLITALSGQGRDRMQADGMLTSSWLQALSRFVAALFTRYNIVDASPVLQYVASELRNGDSTDLELIDQVLAEMAGVKSDINFNDTQVLGMTGGDLLQSVIVRQLADQRHEKKSSAKRLMAALSGPGLTGQILVSIAQERQMYPHREGARDMPLKVLGNNLDKIQQVFAQYLDVLRTNLTIDAFDAAVPGVLELIEEFGLEPGTAFTICRGSMLKKMAEVDAAKKEQQKAELARSKSQEKTVANGDAEMKDAVEMSEKVESEDSSTVKEEKEDVAMAEDAPAADTEADAVVKPASTPAPPALTNGETPPWHPVLVPIMDGLPAVAPDLAARVSVPFFVTFWTLAPQDIHVPMEVYEAEMAKLSSELNKPPERNESSAARLERMRNRPVLTQTIEKLRAEMNDQITGPRGLSQVKMWLNTQKKHWFPRNSTKAERIARHLALLQDCFLPRATMSAVDALYCLQIIKAMHNNATPGFNTLYLLDQLFNKPRLVAIISQCTAREAENLGRFLFEFLKLLAHWHSKQEVYDKEALGSQRQLHGFAKSTDADGAPTGQLEYEEFRRLLTNWHNALTNSLKDCLKSKEYMQIRNSIVMLKTVVSVFPALDFQGKGLMGTLKDLAKDEPRTDLKLAAMSLLGPLKAREATWVKPQHFRLAADGAKEEGGSRAPTPQPKLNAKAEEFKPSATVKAVDGEKTADGKSTPADVKKETTPMTTASTAPAVQPRGPGREQNTRQASAETPRNGPSVTNGASHQASRDAAPSRPASVLPPRPAGAPVKPLPPRPGERGLPGRPERSDERHGRLDRPEDLRQAPSRGQSPGHRSRQRTPERDSRGSFNAPAAVQPGYRDDRPPPRQANDSRHPRDDPRNDPRRDAAPNVAPPARPPFESRNSVPAPSPAVSSPHPDRLSQIRGDGGPPSRQHDQRSSPSHTPGHTTPNAAAVQPSVSVNPERAALISGTNGPTRDRLRERDSKPDSRPPVPRHDSRPNGRIEPPASFRDQQASSRQEPAGDHAPTGPRAGRGGDRDLFEQNGQGRSTGDVARGSTTRNPGPPAQESNYGRLNGPSAPQDVPSGPRAPNGPVTRAGRNFTAPASSASTPAPQPVSSRHDDSSVAPRGPRDVGRQEPSSRNDRHPPSNNVSGTSSADSSAMAGIHPSRAAAFGSANPMPPPLQTNLASNSPRGVASPTTGPPAGPRGSGRPPVGTPTGPSPSVSTPSGPAGPAQRGDQNDRHRANFTNAIGGTNNGPQPPSQGTSFRGAAASRQPSLSGPPTPSGPHTNAQSPAMPFPRDQPSQRDLRSQQGPPSRPESRNGDVRGNERDDGRSRRHEDARDDRPHRSSRESSQRDGRPTDEPPRRPLPPQSMEEGRDRRGPPRSDEPRSRDDRPSRDVDPPRDARRSTRNEEGPPRRGPNDMPQPPSQYGNSNSFKHPLPPQQMPDWQQQQQGRHEDRSRMDDSRRGGRGGPAGGTDRRTDDRRESARVPPSMGAQMGMGRDDNDGRKRRMEDMGPSGPGSDPKRRRSGR